ASNRDTTAPGAPFADAHPAPALRLLPLPASCWLRLCCPLLHSALVLQQNFQRDHDPETYPCDPHQPVDLLVVRCNLRAEQPNAPCSEKNASHLVSRAV